MEANLPNSLNSVLRHCLKKVMTALAFVATATSETAAQEADSAWAYVGQFGSDSLFVQLSSLREISPQRRTIRIRFVGPVLTVSVSEIDCSWRQKLRTVQVFLGSGTDQIAMHDGTPDLFPMPWNYKDLVDPAMQRLIELICADVDPGRWYELFPHPLVALDVTTWSRLPSETFLVWLRWQDEPQLEDPPHRLLHREYNCVDRTERTLQFISYSPEGSVVSSSDELTPWSQPPPESVGEAILNAVCRVTQSLPQPSVR